MAKSILKTQKSSNEEIKQFVCIFIRIAHLGPFYLRWAKHFLCILFIFSSAVFWFGRACCIATANDLICRNDILRKTTNKKIFPWFLHCGNIIEVVKKVLEFHKSLYWKKIFFMLFFQRYFNFFPRSCKNHQKCFFQAVWQFPMKILPWQTRSFSVKKQQVLWHSCSSSTILESTPHELRTILLVTSATNTEVDTWFF